MIDNVNFFYRLIVLFKYMIRIKDVLSYLHFEM